MTKQARTDHRASENAPAWSRELVFDLDVEPAPPTPAFASLCEEFGLALERPEIEQLGRFLAMLLRANETVNLTAVRTPDEGWTRHIFDALTLMAVLADLPVGSRGADVGSGGGVPGVPLAIALPSLDFTLIETTGKKASFLNAAIGALDLPNARVVPERAERLGQDRKHRASYDAVIARAVGPMAVVSELTVPLAKVGGVVALTKGQKADEELEAARRALHRLCVRHEATLDTPTGRIVVLAKERATPNDYPRQPGEPKRSPL